MGCMRKRCAIVLKLWCVFAKFPREIWRLKSGRRHARDVYGHAGKGLPPPAGRHINNISLLPKREPPLKPVHSINIASLTGRLLHS